VSSELSSTTDIAPSLYLYRDFATHSGLGRQAEARNRSVRIRNLPPGTQEGLLQQVLEKYSSVKRVEVFMDQNEAVVELQSPAVSLSTAAST
jgi:squamous cell carcinoma antigen recognized by T-cells 3